MLYIFDVTDKCIKFVAETIKEMPGNPGQEVLVENLIRDADGSISVTVIVEPGNVQIQSSGSIYWRSNHPEAIEQIIDKAEQNTDLIVAQAAIPGPYVLLDAVATGDWKIVGWDS